MAKTESTSLINDQLQGKLVEIITSIQDGVRATKDFAMEQLPDIAMSYVAYGRALETVTVVIALLFALLPLVKLPGLLRKSIGEYGPNEYFAASAVLIAISCFAWAAMFSNISSFLLVWFAPKVWLLKELVNLVK